MRNYPYYYTLIYWDKYPHLGCFSHNNFPCFFTWGIIIIIIIPWFIQTSILILVVLVTTFPLFLHMRYYHYYNYTLIYWDCFFYYSTLIKWNSLLCFVLIKIYWPLYFPTFFRWLFGNLGISFTILKDEEWNKKNLLHWRLSSSSCRTISTDIPDPFSPPFSIVHCFWQVFWSTSHISTELLYVGSSWSSCLCSSMWRGPQGYHADLIISH